MRNGNSSGYFKCLGLFDIELQQNTYRKSMNEFTGESPVLQQF